MRRPAVAALYVAVAAGAAGAQQRPDLHVESSGTRATLQAVSPVNENVVWAGGTAGTVLRTIDGGATWQLRPIAGAEHLQFRGVTARSASEAWVLSSGNGGDSRIYHTRDGGAHWEQQFVNPDSTAFYDCIAFFDAKHGVALSDASQHHTTILRTDDGGAHWSLLPESAVPAPLDHEGSFASSNGCVYTVDAHHGWIAAAEPGARVFRTIDAGKTWRIVNSGLPLVHDSTAGITGIAFANRSDGVAIAARIDAHMQHDTSDAAVATTTDGGVTWTLRHRPSDPGALSGVTLVPPAGPRIILVASYGGVMLSTDGGDTWRALDHGGYGAVRSAGRRAWAVGTSGRITRVDF